MRRPAGRRDERGATAVLVAVVSMALFGAGALAVDVGQVFAKRAALQSTVDMAVLAAAAQLDHEDSCNSEVVTVAATYLTNANITPDQAGVDLSGGPGDTDGFIECQDWTVRLWAPTSHVNFGMAQAVMDETDPGLDVPAYAEAQVRSPKFATLPMYAAQSCVSGGQLQITDPPNGQQKLKPPDFPETGAVVEGLKFNGPPAPDRFLDADLAAGNTTITLKVTPKFEAGDVITFTRHDDIDAPWVPYSVPSSAVGDTKVSFSLPATVTGDPGLWWVRVQRGGVFMADEHARSITVGDLGVCNGSLSGNFGTLNIARADHSHELIKNIIFGAEPTLALSSLTAPPCPVAQSETQPTDGTDCVSTKPGFPGNELTQGLVTGLNSGLPKGRLDADTTQPCSRSGDGSRTPGSYALNDDTLACFLTGDAAVSDVVLGGGGQNSLSGDVLGSPRFFRIPQLPEDPAHGASVNYPITDFYYVFLTGEASGPITGYNGLTMRPNGTRIQSMTVAVLDPKSLPTTVTNDGHTTDYGGSGPKVVVLVR